MYAPFRARERGVDGTATDMVMVHAQVELQVADSNESQYNLSSVLSVKVPPNGAFSTGMVCSRSGLSCPRVGFCGWATPQGSYDAAKT